jgi:hypothetical protein
MPGMVVEVRYIDGSFYPATVIRLEAQDGEDYVLVRWAPDSSADYPPTFRAHIDDIRKSWAVPSAGRG